MVVLAAGFLFADNLNDAKEAERIAEALRKMEEAEAIRTGKAKNEAGKEAEKMAEEERVRQGKVENTASSPAPASSISGDGRVFFSTRPPKANVYIDGKFVGTSNENALPVPVGTYSVRFEKDGIVKTETMSFNSGNNGKYFVDMSLAVPASGGPSVGRSRASIQSVVERNMGGLLYAYNMRLRVKPGLAGKIAVKFSIDEFGNVISAKIVESTVSDSELESTVVSHVKNWNFGKIDKPGDVSEVTYPFTFSQ
jgi:TonB family protein